MRSDDSAHEDNKEQPRDQDSAISRQGLLWKYVEQMNRGEAIDEAELRSNHPDVADEVVRQLAAFREIGDEEAGCEPQPLGTLGDYTLRRQIGRGGMGVVYEAWENSMDRAVALKVLPAGVAVDDRSFQRFMQEARTAGKLSHRNVVPVHAMGQVENTPYFAMEYVEGETLATILAKTKDADPETETPFGKKDSLVYFGKLADAFADVADGLQHAHSKGVTHRDIKPSNLILDGEGRLRILDFGLARLDGQESLTLSGDFVGTPLYMSPEQARRKKIPVDHRTDVYSLGATMYEAICGRPPFRGKDHADTLSQIIERKPAEPRRINPVVPRDLETIVLKCLRKEAGDRYGTAEALGQDLRRLVRGDAVEARPESALEKFARTFWRHRVLAAAALAVLVVTALLCGVSALLIHGAQVKAQKAYEEEKNQRERADENFQLAREVVDRVLLTHLDSRIAEVPGMQRVRQLVLQEGLAFYQRFLEQKGGDPAVRFEAARAFLRVGVINDVLGEQERAAETYTRAVACLSGLAKEFPDTPKYRRLLAETYRKRGELYLPLGECPAAEESFRLAVSIDRALAEETAEDTEQLPRLAESLTGLGRAFSCGDHYAEADQAFEEAREIHERLQAGSTSDAALRLQFSDLLHQSGRSFFRRGELAKAKKLFVDAIRHLEAVTEGDSTDHTYRYRLSSYYDGLSVLLHRLGQREEEVTIRRKRLEVSRALVIDDPDIPSYRSQYVDALKDHAALLYRTGRVDESEEPFREALVEAQSLSGRFPEAPVYRQLVARTKVQFAQALIALDRLGEAEEILRSAWPAWRQLVQSSPSSSVYVGNLVLTSSLLSLLLDQAGRRDELERHFREAKGFLEKLLALQDGETEALALTALRAWLARLLTDAPESFRDPQRAVSLAEQTIEVLGTQSCYQTTLGVAYYRNDQWQEAISALHRAMELDSVCSGPQFFLAMAHWQLGERQQAAQWYDEAVKWMEENDPVDPELARLREEAQVLLGR